MIIQINESNVQALRLLPSQINKFYVTVGSCDQVCDTKAEALDLYKEMQFSYTFDLAMNGEMLHE